MAQAPNDFMTSVQDPRTGNGMGGYMLDESFFVPGMTSQTLRQRQEAEMAAGRDPRTVAATGSGFTDSLGDMYGGRVLTPEGLAEHDRMSQLDTNDQLAQGLRSAGMLAAAPFAASAMMGSAAPAAAGTEAGAVATPVVGGGGAMGTALPSTGAMAGAGGGGFTGSMAMPELAGSMPAGVTGFSSAIPAAGATGALDAGGWAAGAGMPAAAEGIAATGAAGAAAGAASTPAVASTGDSLFSKALSPLLGTAVKGLVGGAINNALSPNPQKAIDAADPFSTQRPQYQPQLQEMMQGRFSPTDPSYDFRFNQGQKAMERTLAASGMGKSGNALTALMQYGQGMASSEYQNQYQRLAQLSGANFGTGAAGGIAQQQAAAQSGQAAAATNGIINFGQGLYDNWNKTVSPAAENTLNFGGYENLDF